jgi:hypothetical protein
LPGINYDDELSSCFVMQFRLGNVKERQTQVFVSEEVMLAKELVTSLGDFRVTENSEEQMVSDMKEMASLLVGEGQSTMFRCSI